MGRTAFAVVSAVLLAGCGDSDPGSDQTQVRRGVEAIDGIPQDGFTLGRPDAPWTLTVIAAATSYELDHLITQLPALVDEFVRPGRVNVQMRTPSTGPYGANGEERAAAGVLLAAGLQGRYWDALVRFVPAYRGGIQEDDLRRLLRSSGVPDVRRAMTERSSPRVRAALARADGAAADADGDGRVVYHLSPGEGEPRDITVDSSLGKLAEAVAVTLG